jgi:hypothetical protein
MAISAAGTYPEPYQVPVEGSHKDRWNEMEKRKTWIGIELLQVLLSNMFSNSSDV